RQPGYGAGRDYERDLASAGAVWDLRGQAPLFHRHGRRSTCAGGPDAPSAHSDDGTVWDAAGPPQHARCMGRGGGTDRPYGLDAACSAEVLLMVSVRTQSMEAGDVSMGNDL